MSWGTRINIHNLDWIPLWCRFTNLFCYVIAFLFAALIYLIPLPPCFSMIYSIPILVNAPSLLLIYLIPTPITWFQSLLNFILFLLLRSHSIPIIFSCACSISFNLELLLPCYYPITLFHIATLSHFFWYKALSYFKFQLWIIAAATVSYYTYTLIVAAWLFGFHFQLLWIVASRCCLFYLENPSKWQCLPWLFYSVPIARLWLLSKVKRFHHKENWWPPCIFFISAFYYFYD